MKKLLVFLCAITLVFAVARTAAATPFTFLTGDESRIDTSGTEDGLVMWADVYSTVHNFDFTLAEGMSITFPFARIGTYETQINNDDLNPVNMTAYADFELPALEAAIGGTSVGFECKLLFWQGWNVVWEEPKAYSFGNGGEFTIDLSDASFVSGNWFGPAGEWGNAYADVYATVKLNSEPGLPVPEPATMVLLGAGLIGVAAFGRKKFFK